MDIFLDSAVSISTNHIVKTLKMFYKIRCRARSVRQSTCDYFGGGDHDHKEQNTRFFRKIVFIRPLPKPSRLFRTEIFSRLS